jgi:hypothetical protein
MGCGGYAIFEPAHIGTTPWAGAEEFDGVIHVGEAMICGHRRGPAFDRRPGHLEGSSALSAHEVMMVPAAAPPIKRLADRGQHYVDFAIVGERLQGAINRGQTHLHAAVAEHRVQFFGGVKAIDVVEQIADRRALSAATSASHPTPPSGAHALAHGDHYMFPRPPIGLPPTGKKDRTAPIDRDGY